MTLPSHPRLPAPFDDCPLCSGSARRGVPSWGPCKAACRGSHIRCAAVWRCSPAVHREQLLFFGRCIMREYTFIFQTTAMNQSSIGGGGVALFAYRLWVHPVSRTTCHHPATSSWQPLSCSPRCHLSPLPPTPIGVRIALAAHPFLHVPSPSPASSPLPPFRHPLLPPPSGARPRRSAGSHRRRPTGARRPHLSTRRLVLCGCNHPPAAHVCPPCVWPSRRRPPSPSPLLGCLGKDVGEGAHPTAAVAAAFPFPGRAWSPKAGRHLNPPRLPLPSLPPSPASSLP